MDEPEPLRISVEIVDAIVFDPDLGHHCDIARCELERIIDARVKPLVESAQVIAELRADAILLGDLIMVIRKHFPASPELCDQTVSFDIKVDRLLTRVFKK